MFWLGVLVTVAFTAWRLVGNLKALGESVARLNQRLTPALEELAAKGEEAAAKGEALAERAARLQERGRPHDHP
ncbi:MAG TPA: hypothetical protein VGM21_12565 [Actinomycetota bacterium]